MTGSDRVNVRRGDELSRLEFLRRGGMAFGAVAIGPTLLAACGGGDETGGKGRPLTIAAPATPTGFDREFNVTTGDLEQTSNVFSNLLTLDTRPARGISADWNVFEQDANNVVPNLAESWNLSEGGTKLTMTLRKGVKSNYGNELTAEDAVWSFERVVPLGGSNSFLFFEGGYGDPKTSEFEVVDDYTFSVKAECPAAMLVRSQVSVWQWIYDSKEAKKHATGEDEWASEWLKRNPCGHGPYLVDDFKPGEQVAYKANPDYFGEKPKIESVIYRQVPSSSTRVTLLQEGEVDVATFLRPDELKRLERADGVRVLYFEGNYLTYIVPNQKNFEPFTDDRVRHALAFATPQEEIGATIYNGRGKVMDSVVPSTYPTYNGSFFRFKHNPERAKELLRQAGYGDGLEFTAMYTDAIPELEDLGVALQTAYRKVGVEMKLERRPPASYFDSLYGPNKTYQAALSRELAVVPDPVHATYQFFYSKSPINTAQIDDPQLDKLLLDSLCLPEQGREGTFRDVQRIIMEKAVWIPVWAPGNQVAVRSDLQGFTWQYNNGFFWAAAERV